MTRELWKIEVNPKVPGSQTTSSEHHIAADNWDEAWQIVKTQLWATATLLRAEKIGTVLVKERKT